MKELEGKVAVVTGAARGIGLGFAKAAINEGMRVILTDIDEAQLKTEVAALVEAGATAIGLPVDVSSAESIDRLADTAYDAFGAVHVLVSNAGVVDLHATWERSRDDWRRVMDINLGGTMNAIWSFIPKMLASGEEGHVVCVSSSASFRWRTGVASYNASKAAVLAVCETLAQELISIEAPIGVSVVMPGPVQSRLSQARESRTEGEAIPELAPGMRTTADVADQMINAIRDERFYVFTHPETYPDYERKLLAVLAAVKGDKPAPVVIDPWGGGPDNQPVFSRPERSEREDNSS